MLCGSPMAIARACASEMMHECMLSVCAPRTVSEDRQCDAEYCKVQCIVVFGDSIVAADAANCFSLHRFLGHAACPPAWQRHLHHFGVTLQWHSGVQELQSNNETTQSVQLVDGARASALEHPPGTWGKIGMCSRLYVTVLHPSWQLATSRGYSIRMIQDQPGHPNVRHSITCAIDLCVRSVAADTKCSS